MSNIKKEVINAYYDNSKYHLSAIISPFKKSLRKVFVLSFLINLLTVMLPLFIMFFIDGKIIFSFEGKGLVNIIMLVLIICFNFIFRYVRANVVNYILSSVDSNICNGILEKVFKMPAKKMEKKTEAFWHSVFSDIDVIRNGLSGSYIINMFDIPFVLIFMGTIGVLFGKYFFVMLFIFLVYLAIMAFASYMLSIVDDNEKLAIKERDELVSNTIHNLSSLKTLSLSDKIMYMWKDYQANIIDNAYKRNYTLDMFLILSFITYFIGLIIFSLVGEYSYNIGILSIGGIITILLLFSQSFHLINSFIKYLPQYFKFTNSVERLSQVMSEQVDALKTDVVEDITLGNLELKNMTLLDNRNKVILKDVNFTFKDNNLYVLRAKNTFDGSVFLKSLFSGYDLEKGEILFDRYNVANLKTESLKDYIHYAAQNSFVIEGTVKENLNCLLSKNVDDDFSGFMDYKKISKDLGFDQIISKLPNGYNTLIDGKTNLMSGEELKLLSIARVFVGNPRVVLLDQPFFGLSKKYKEKLVKFIESVSSDKIIIVSTMEKEFSKKIVLNFDDEKINSLTSELFDEAAKDILDKIPSYDDETDPSETRALFKRIFRKK